MRKIMEEQAMRAEQQCQKLSSEFADKLKEFMAEPK